MAGSSVGLVLRAGAVEVVQLARGLGGVKVVSSTRLPIGSPSASGAPAPPGSLESDEARVPAAIRQALASLKAKPARVTVSIAPHEVLLRSFSIPTIPKTELETAVQFEARKYIPFKLEDLVWDYLAVPRADRHTDIIFAAVERPALLQVQGWLKQAGVQPTSVEPRSFSLARVVQRSQQVPRGCFAALVDLDEQGAHINVAKDGVVYLARSVTFDGGVAPAGETQDAASTTTTSRAERLLSELRLSMDFFTREFSGAAINRVVLFGEAQEVNAWCRAFSTQVPCPVEAGRVSVGATAGAVQGTLAAAVGAALTEERGAASINFLQRSAWEHSAAGERGAAPRVRAVLARLNKPVLALSTAVAAALFLALWMVGAQRVGAQRRQLQALSRTRPDVGWGLTVRSQADLEPIRVQADVQRAFLRRAVEGRISVTSKLDALARSLPDGIWLTSFTYDDTLAVDGTSQRMGVVSGACFLGERGRELAAIQAFDDVARHNAAFFQGFVSAQLKEISDQLAPNQRNPYRTFQLNYASSRSLQ